MIEAEIEELTDYELSTFIDHIDRDPVKVNAFEFKFIKSNAHRARPFFSDKQRNVIYGLIKKYAVVIGWERPMREEPEDLPF